MNKTSKGNSHCNRPPFVPVALLAALLSLHAAPSPGQAVADGIIELKQAALAAGGGRSSGGTFVLAGTIGQPWTGRSSAALYHLAAGFWPATVASQEPEAPALSIRLKDQRVVVAWPSSARGFRLQSSTGLDSSASWTHVEDAPVLANGEWTVELPQADRLRFFRLLGVQLRP